MSGSAVRNIARYWAGRQPPGERADATLLFFQALRKNPAWRALYLAEAGCLTGFEHGHHGKQHLNAAIARTLKDAMDAENDPAGRVDAPAGEFIEKYQPFLPG